MTFRQLAATLLTAAFTTSMTPAVRAVDLDPAAQKKQQQKAIADVEETARRITTSLRVLGYQNVDAVKDKELLK